MKTSNSHIQTFAKAIATSTLILSLFYASWQIAGLAGERWGHAWELLQSTFGIAAGIGGAWVAILIASNAEKIAANAVQLTKAEHIRELNKRTVDDVTATQALILDLIKSIRSVVTSCSLDSLMNEARDVALLDILAQTNSKASTEIETFIRTATNPRYQQSRQRHLEYTTRISNEMRDAPKYRSRIESIADVLENLGNALLTALNDFRLVRLFSSKEGIFEQNSETEASKRREFFLRYADACLLSAMRLRRIHDDHVLHLGRWALSVAVLGKKHAFGKNNKTDFMVHDSFTVFGNIISQDLLFDFSNDQLPYIAGSLLLGELQNLIPTVDEYKNFFQRIKEEHGLDSSSAEGIDVSSSLLNSLQNIGFATQLGHSYIGAARIANSAPAEHYHQLFSEQGTILDETALNSLIIKVAQEHWFHD